MITFFALLTALGALCIAADITAGQTSDSIPIPLARLGGIGVAMAATGIIGATCIWLFP